MKSALLAGLVIVGIAELEARAPAQLGVGLARVVVPPLIQFQVTNVGVDTMSSAVTVSFDSAVLGVGEGLRISVRADGDLTLPGSPAIPATNISWTTSSVANGVGLIGTLSKTVYTPVYQGNVGASNGRVDITWKLAAPGAGILAGTRQAVLRWRFEAVTP